jgi:hypothetical protein
MTWVKFDPDLGDNDYPLHAGTCLDVLRGDLLHAATENACDFCIGPPMDFSANTYWVSGTLDPVEWYESLVYPPIPIRPKAWTLTPRTITISLFTRLSGAGTAEVRVYVRGSRTAMGLLSDSHYGSGTVDSTTPSWVDFVIAPPDLGRPLGCNSHPADDLDSLPPDVDESMIVIHARCSTAVALWTYAMRIQEGAP